MLVGQDQVRFAALEKRLEERAEIGAHLLEGGLELFARGGVDFGDGLMQVVFGLEKVLLLREQELIAFFELRMFFRRGEVDGAHAFQPAFHAGKLFGVRRHLAVRRARLFHRKLLRVPQRPVQSARAPGPASAPGIPLPGLAACAWLKASRQAASSSSCACRRAWSSWRSVSSPESLPFCSSLAARRRPRPAFFQSGSAPAAPGAGRFRAFPGRSASERSSKASRRLWAFSSSRSLPSRRSRIVSASSRSCEICARCAWTVWRFSWSAASCAWKESCRVFSSSSSVVRRISSC